MLLCLGKLCLCTFDVLGKKEKKHKTVDELVKLKDGYEEAIGISTPSKEMSCLNTQSSLVRLANNKVLTAVCIFIMMQYFNISVSSICMCPFNPFKWLFE